jgi:hypothetical protein
MTAQAGDLIEYIGKAYILLSNPLEQYFEAGHQRPKCLAEEIEYRDTSNWRGYVAEWTINNDIFFIINIEGPNGEVSRAMSELFPDAQPPIEASWYSGKLRLRAGKMLQYVHMGYGTRYEKEIILHVKKGRVVKKKIIDNRGKTFNEDKLKRIELRKLAKWEEKKKRANSGITSADNRAHTILERIKSALRRFF